LAETNSTETRSTGSAPPAPNPSPSIISNASQSPPTPSNVGAGIGGGYLPPVLGSKSRPAGPVPDFRFGPGMTVVVRPNVVTRDGTAGVQTGELVHITEKGVDRLHQAPKGFIRV
jgi:hypothetical protein